MAHPARFAKEINHGHQQTETATAANSASNTRIEETAQPRMCRVRYEFVSLAIDDLTSVRYVLDREGSALENLAAEIEARQSQPAVAE